MAMMVEYRKVWAKRAARAVRAALRSTSTPGFSISQSVQVQSEKGTGHLLGAAVAQHAYVPVDSRWSGIPTYVVKDWEAPADG